MLSRKPVTVLIAALGGQGGGVLTDWIVVAARAEGATVQATSIPGVSQRTGATTYYIEIAATAPGAMPPVLGLAPVPGQVDVLVCAELLEAARMLERGMSVPSRTTVIASTHRVYTTREKMSGGDGRFDGARVADAVRALSRHATLLDMEAIRRRHHTVISAALFGAVAGTGALPFGRAACEEAICGSGKGVAASLAAFDEAFLRAQQAMEEAPAKTGDPSNGGVAISQAVPAAIGDAGRPRTTPLPAEIARGLAALPDRVAEFARIGAADLIVYQDDRYAARYLDRVARIIIAERRAGGNGDTHEIARETARYLALWMRYDDVIRVASEKIRASRFARIRDEAAASQEAVVRVYDYFKPSALELAAILPRRLGAWVERRALVEKSVSPAGNGRTPRASAGKGVTLQTTSFAGALALRLVAALRPARPHSLRYAREQEAIEDWLVALELALTHDRMSGGDAALAVARLPRLIRGYSATHAAGRANFRRILDAYRRAAAGNPKRAGDELRKSALAALNDPACGTHDRPPDPAVVRSAAASLRA